jgi:hypothetical protein
MVSESLTIVYMFTNMTLMLFCKHFVIIILVLYLALGLFMRYTTERNIHFHHRLSTYSVIDLAKSKLVSH